jgi:hypothetical protein
MSVQQVNGMIFCLLGLAALIVSVGIAWTLARVSRVRRVNGAGMMSVASLVFFIASLVACWFGVSALIEG